MAFLSNEFNQLLAGTIATTILAVTLFVLSLTVVGTILVALIGLIDVVLLLLGAEAYSPTAFVTAKLASALYNVDTIVDIPDEDGTPLLAFGQRDYDLPDGSAAAGSPLAISLPITASIRHRWPGETPRLFLSAIPYVKIHYTRSRLESSNFDFVFDDHTTEVDNWTSQKDGRKFLLTSLYSASANDTIRTTFNLSAGINKRINREGTINYDLPGFECYTAPITGIFFLAAPICVNETIAGSSTFNVANGLVLDVFPAHR